LKVRVLAAALVFGLLLMPVSLPADQTAAPALPYTMLSRDARRPLAARTIGGQEMFALDDLARLFNLTVREEALAGGLTVGVNGQTIVLSPQQPLASVAGRMISLPAAPVRDGRVWYVPVDFVGRALAPIFGSRLELRKPSRLILIGDIRMPRVASHGEVLGNLTRVIFDVAPPTPHTVTQEGSRLLIRFDADALDATLPPAPATDVLQNVRVGDTPQVIALDLGPRFASFRVSDQSATAGAARIVVDLIAQTEAPPPPGTPPTPQPPFGQPGQPAPGAPPEPPPLLDLPPAGGLRAIVIDPGHGGDETGAKGPQGILEKNITLAVARRLKAALEGRLGVRVLLTREGDQTIPLDQRAALANNNKADLFLSLHANASLRPTVTGAEVFFLSLAEYGEEAQEAARAESETLPVLGGGNRDIEVVLWDMAQARHIEQSAAFARTIEAALRERVPMTPHSLQQAGFRVLVGANMPAVLVEMGFLTNPQQEQRLASDDYQNALVQALVDGIVRYRGAIATPTGAGEGR
jgi:N-acetylmuramoyl-L-alanine amidase